MSSELTLFTGEAVTLIPSNKVRYIGSIDPVSDTGVNLVIHLEEFSQDTPKHLRIKLTFVYSQTVRGSIETRDETFELKHVLPINKIPANLCARVRDGLASKQHLLNAACDWFVGQIVDVEIHRSPNLFVEVAIRTNFDTAPYQGEAPLNQFDGLLVVK